MKTLNLFAASAIVALGILFFPACGPGNPGDEDGGSCADKADCPNPDGGTVTYKVTATAPEGVVPQHYKINGTRIDVCLKYDNGTGATCKVQFDMNQSRSPCTDTATCTVHLGREGTFRLVPEHEKFAFEDRKITVSSTTALVTTDWNDPGNYGIQVGTVAEVFPFTVSSAEYEENEHGNPSVYHMYTAVGESGHVELLGGMWNSATNVILTGYSFEGENDRYSLRGAVSQDLSTIHYHISYVDGTEDDVNLNRR